MKERDAVRQRTTMPFCWACSCTAMLQQELRQGMALAESEDRKQVADGMDVPQDTRRRERSAALQLTTRPGQETGAAGPAA